MPLPKPSLCIFGDSHIASIKEAVNEELVDISNVDIEFWGNIGRRFRFLTWNNERIEPLDTFTAHRFAKFSKKNRTFLAADDFDMILFSGCRLSLYKIFPELLHSIRTQDSWISSGILSRIIADYLRDFPPYQFARNFAKQGKTLPVFAPISFETEGFDTTVPAKFKSASQATLDDRSRIWDTVEKIMVEDGVILLRQDESSVIHGCKTHASYGVKDYIDTKDATHKNAEYGALVLKSALKVLGEQTVIAR